jgi:hypothetical protein
VAQIGHKEVAVYPALALPWIAAQPPGSADYLRFIQASISGKIGT